MGRQAASDAPIKAKPIAGRQDRRSASSSAVTETCPVQTTIPRPQPSRATAIMADIANRNQPAARTAWDVSNPRAEGAALRLLIAKARLASAAYPISPGSSVTELLSVRSRFCRSARVRTSLRAARQNPVRTRPSASHHRRTGTGRPRDGCSGPFPCRS